jgi:hypothetical protein
MRWRPRRARRRGRRRWQPGGHGLGGVRAAGDSQSLGHNDAPCPLFTSHSASIAVPKGWAVYALQVTVNLSRHHNDAPCPPLTSHGASIAAPDSQSPKGWAVATLRALCCPALRSPHLGFLGCGWRSWDRQNMEPQGNLSQLLLWPIPLSSPALSGAGRFCSLGAGVSAKMGVWRRGRRSRRQRPGAASTSGHCGPWPRGRGGARWAGCAVGVAGAGGDHGMDHDQN